MSNVYFDHEDEHAQEFNTSDILSNQRSNEGVRKRPRKGAGNESARQNGNTTGRESSGYRQSIPRSSARKVEDDHSGQQEEEKEEFTGNDDKIKGMAVDLDEHAKVVKVVSKFEDEYFAVKKKYNDIDEHTLNADINMKTMIHCYNLIKKFTSAEHPNFDPDQEGAGLTALLAKVKNVNGQYNHLKGEFQAVQELVLNKDTFSLKLDQVQDALQKQQEIFQRIQGIDPAIHENEEAVNQMKAGYEGFEQSVFEMWYGCIVATTNETNQKFKEIYAQVVQIKAQTGDIKSKVEFFKPQNDEQRKRLEEVNQEIFAVEQLMKKVDTALAAQETARTTLVGDFQKCTKIVDDIKEYSPWQDSEKLNLVELVAQTRTVEVLCKNNAGWNDLLKRLKSVQEDEIKHTESDLVKTNTDNKKFLDSVKNNRKDQQDELIKRVQKQAKRNDQLLLAQQQRLDHFEATTLDFEITQHVADQDFCFLNKEVNRYNCSIIAAKAQKEVILQDALKLDSERKNSQDHMIDPAVLTKLEQCNKDLERQQDIAIVQITKNIDSLEDYSVKALRNRLNDDNKKSQAQISAMKKSFEELQVVIDTLNRKAATVRSEYNSLHNQFNSEDLEKENEFSNKIEYQLDACEKDINGSKEDANKGPQQEKDDGGRAEQKTDLVARKKMIIGRINKMVNQFNDNNKAIKESNKDTVTDKEINDLVIKNEEIQNECTTIVEKILSAKVFGNEIDERLDSISKPVITDAQDKYADKNKIVDECDELFDANEEFVKNLEAELVTIGENTEIVSSKIKDVSPLNNPSHAGQDNAAFVQDVTKKNEVAQGLLQEIESLKGQVEKCKDTLIDDIQPLNELGEREVHQPEIEDILAKMKAMKVKLDGLEKQIKPLEAQNEQLDAEVDDMIHDEKTSKIHTGDGQLTQLNLDIADIDAKKTNAEKLLARYRGAIANAKKKEGRDDAALSDWLSTLGTEADGIDGQIDEVGTQAKAIKEDRDSVKKIIDEASDDPSKFTPYAIDQLIANLEEQCADAETCQDKISAIETELERRIAELEDKVGKSREKKNLIDLTGRLRDELSNDFGTLAKLNSSLPEQLNQLLQTLKEMKIGAEPDDAADYWEEKKNIERHIKALTQGQVLCTNLGDEVKRADKKIQTILEDTKTPSECSDLLRATQDLQKLKATVENLLNDAYDIRDLYDDTKKEMDDCQIPVNIKIRNNEIEQFSEKLERIQDEFKDLKTADGEFAGGQESEMQIKDMIKKIGEKLKGFENEKKAFIQFQKRTLEAYKPRDFVAAANVPIIIEIRKFKAEIEDAHERLKEVEGLENELNNMLILQDFKNAVKLLEVKSGKQRIRLETARAELVRINTCGTQMDGNTSHNEEEEFIDALGDEMPEVFKNIDGNFDKLDNIDLMLEQVKQSQNIEQMTKLKQEIDDTNEKLEQCEGLVNKLENEVIEWDSLKKLCRRDEELNEIDVLVKDFDADLSKENTTMQALLEKNESKLENSTQQKDIEDFTYLVEGIKAYQVDIQKLQDQIDELSEEKQRTFAAFDEDVPAPVKEEREARKAMQNKGKKKLAPGNTFSDKPTDMYYMIEINCKYRKTIHDLLKKLRYINQQRRDLEERYGQLKRDLNQVKEVKVYKPVKGDAIDELFAYHLNLHQLALPVQRVGPGKYMFGSKQILAKIINGKLVIRVGGGYMSADEFIEQYGKIELLKMMKAQQSAADGEDFQAHGRGGASGSPTARSSMQDLRASKSPMDRNAQTIRGTAVGMGDMKTMMRESMSNIKTYEGGHGSARLSQKLTLNNLEKTNTALRFGGSPRTTASSGGLGMKSPTRGGQAGAPKGRPSQR